ncbi:unnamed protein product [Closterium sp. NIES-53]
MAPRPQAPRPLILIVPAAATTATATATTTAATAASATPACCTAMASLRVLAFDHEGRPVQFDTWLDDLQLIVIFDLDFDAILSAMYALSASAEGDCYRCVPPDPGIVVAALGASDSGLHLPSFSTNLVSTAALQDAMVTTTTPGGQVVASCSCRLPSHQTLLWHRRLGHPSLPHLRGMHSRLLVSGLPRSLPPLPPSPALPCLSCVEGRKRTTPHSSSFPPTTAHLQTLHMDMWGPARVSGQSRERYFLLVVDDYTRYTTVFPLRSKGHDLPVLRLHSDRGGELSSDLLRDFFRGEGILRSFTLPDSPQQNGIAERRIGLVMEFYHPTSRRVFPSQDVKFNQSVPFYHLFPSPAPAALPCSWSPSGRPPPTLGSCSLRCLSGRPSPWGAGPGGAGSVGAETGGAEPGGVEPGGGETGGTEPEGVEPGGAASEGAEFGGAEPQGAASSGGSPNASSRLSLQQLREWFVWRARLRSEATGAGGAGATGAGGAGAAAGAGVTGGTATTGPGGSRTRGAGAAGTGGVEGAGAGDPTESRATGAGSSGTDGAGAGGARVGGTGAGGSGVRGPGVGGAGAGGAGAIDPSDASQPASPLPAPSPYTEQSGGLTERREPVSCPVSPFCTARLVSRSHPPPVPGTHAMTLRPSSVPLHVPLLAPPESSFPEVPDPESDRTRAASPTVSRLLATAVMDPSFETAGASALVAELLDFATACRLDYATTLVAESASASPSSIGVSRPFVVGDSVALFHITILWLLGFVGAGSHSQLEDFVCLSDSVPCFASMLLALEGDPDAPDIPTPRSYVEAITGPYSSQWQAAMDAKMASWKSTGTYVEELPPPGANKAYGMWIFRVKRPPGSLPAFKAHYDDRGFSQRQGVDYFQTFSPTPKMTTLRVLLHVAAQRDYELHSLDFIYGLRQAPREWHDTLRTILAALGFAPATADPSLFLRTDTSLPPFYVLVYVNDLVIATTDTEALTLVKSELQKRHTCTDVGELRSYLGLQITRDRARRTITLTQSHMVHQVFQRFGFQFSSPQPTPLSISHSLSAPPSDESVESSGPYAELVGCLTCLMTCTRPDLAYHLSLLACYVAPGRHRKVHWDAAKRVVRYLCSTSGMGLVLGGRGSVVLTSHADASWVDDSTTQRSSQGYTFRLCFLAVYPFVFGSQLQL